MPVKRSTAYDALAIAAARREKVDPPTPEAAAEHRGARQARDRYWEEYERMLRDTRTYTLDVIWEWLATEYHATCGRSTVHRDRLRLMEPIKSAELAAARAKAVIDAAGDDEGGLFRAGRILGSQVIFDALSTMPYDALEHLEPSQILRMLETLAKLGKSHVESDLITQRLTEMRDRYDTEIAAAQERAKAGGDGDGRIRPEDILAVRKAVFGEVA